MAAAPQSERENPRRVIGRAIDHLDHVLPGQAPILNFVHHNTLHGYQHLDFAEALAKAEQRTGNHGYLPEPEFRKLYAQGRIDDSDLEASLAANIPGETDDTLPIPCRELDRLQLVYGFEALSPANLAWEIAENAALSRLQPDLPETVRDRLLQRPGAGGEATLVSELWNACLNVLQIAPIGSGAETGVATTEAAIDEVGISPRQETPDIRADAENELERLLAAVGAEATLRGLLLELTGRDLLDDLRPELIRFCASHLDEGLASWISPDRGDGLYATWRRCAATEPGSAARRGFCGRLPEDPIDAIIHCFAALGLEPDRWPGYLERAALELPGWAGIINWRQRHPGYPANRAAPAALADLLAIRLALEYLAADRLCRSTWDIAADLAAIRRYFRRHPGELYARHALASGELPEFLTDALRSQEQLPRAGSGQRRGWEELAGGIANWRAGTSTQPTAHRHGWRLFRLAQHLGYDGNEVGRLSRADALSLLRAVDRLTPRRRGYLWLWAYERHYRDRLFAALAANHGRGPWRQRRRRPAAQVVFCMDDREEGVRRHLEELNPEIETLGAAGFFGVPINWRGLDDHEVTPLCPVVVTPSHEVREVATADTARHRRGLQLATALRGLWGREIRRNLISSQALIDLLAPAALFDLGARILAPHRHAQAGAIVSRGLLPQVPTRLEINAAADSPAATPERPRQGFTDQEQADRVAGFLRLIGLTDGLAPLVVIAGHGSISRNNPHLAAYDCGACSGRHGGPNARTFAAMANRPEVREILATRGLPIPADTWFLGCEHNTCNEDWQWFDLDAMPEAFMEALAALRADLDRSLRHSAHERCRRLASAPRHPSLPDALAHMQGRSADLSQARPELGHATNAAAVIGRRSVTRGTFLDRRVFLISYDPSGDANGTLLESILLAAGPVGAGINLEYYFSTVDNERYGCGSKVPHNVTGWFAVMEGGGSDLRTGLPRQMVEIHEAMRLQVIVEANTDVVTAIYRRQPPLRELIGRGWILLSAIDPESGELSVFDPQRGFLPWEPGPPPPAAADSASWYGGHSGPLAPALIGSVPP
ncbi:MAG: DUF2309 domain-containing protein [Methylococcaceae bacterium]|nr:DUF2309 domain-containing protein [Methylococcaceae bacterium]